MKRLRMLAWRARWSWSWRRAAVTRIDEGRQRGIGEHDGHIRERRARRRRLRRPRCRLLPPRPTARRRPGPIRASPRTRSRCRRSPTPASRAASGLNQELFDTAEAFTKWCNEHGGINGRKIVLKERDAKLTEFQQRVIEACDQGDFFIVGGGAVFDDTGQKDRLACGLPAIPGYVVTPAATEADLAIQPVPNPDNAATRRARSVPVQKRSRDQGRGRRLHRRDRRRPSSSRHGNKEALDHARLRRSSTTARTTRSVRRRGVPFLEAMRNDGREGSRTGSASPATCRSSSAKAASLDIKFDWVATDPNNYDPQVTSIGDRGRRHVHAHRVLPVPRSRAAAKENPATAAVPRPHDAVQARAARSRTSASRACRPGCCSPRPRASAAPTSRATACGRRPGRSRVDRRRAARAAQPEDRRRSRLLACSRSRAASSFPRTRFEPTDGIYNCDGGTSPAEGRLRDRRQVSESRRTPPIRSRPTVRNEPGPGRKAGPAVREGAG